MKKTCLDEAYDVDLSFEDSTTLMDFIHKYSDTFPLLIGGTCPVCRGPVGEFKIHSLLICGHCRNVWTEKQEQERLQCFLLRKFPFFDPDLWNAVKGRSDD